VASRLDSTIERIRSLLAAPVEGGDAPPREDLEATLTEGYAEALALDGQRLRLERRIDELTKKLARGGDNHEELRKLMSQLAEAEADLEGLRELLLDLRQRAAKAA
jgi:hypothetical protein